MRQYESLTSVDEHDTRRREESISSSFAELDEVDAGMVCLPPQPPKVPQATYVVLSSFDIIQLTVTRSALDVLADVVKVSIITIHLTLKLSCVIVWASFVYIINLSNDGEYPPFLGYFHFSKKGLNNYSNVKSNFSG